eukprot:scaffold4176_cov54-Isochrysis_galbana.AAC.2
MRGGGGCEGGKRDANASCAFPHAIIHSTAPAPALAPTPALALSPSLLSLCPCLDYLTALPARTLAFTPYTFTATCPNDLAAISARPYDLAAISARPYNLAAIWAHPYDLSAIWAHRYDLAAISAAQLPLGLMVSPPAPAERQATH